MPDTGPEKHRQMLHECNNFHYAVETCLERPLRRNDKYTGEEQGCSCPRTIEPRENFCPCSRDVRIGSARPDRVQ